MARPALRLPAPLVFLVRSRTVVEGGLDGVRTAEMDPVIGRVLEVGEQDLALLTSFSVAFG
jgi:hypothetical protein